MLRFCGIADSDISAITAVVTIPLGEYSGREFRQGREIPIAMLDSRALLPVGFADPPARTGPF